jgi:hypothetical protein
MIIDRCLVFLIEGTLGCTRAIIDAFYWCPKAMFQVMSFTQFSKVPFCIEFRIVPFHSLLSTMFHNSPTLISLPPFLTGTIRDLILW